MIGLRAQAGPLFVEAGPGFTFSGGPNWSYDAQSETVIIHEQMVNPKEAGLAKTGTSGIDIDKMLGF